jgi:hypothetical protein
MLVPDSNTWTPARKVLVVAAVVIVLLGVSALVYGYRHYQASQPKEGVERIEDLGSGFRRITIAKFNKSELGHYQFLYYHDRRLSQLNTPPSISPSGNFAVYQEVPSGKLMLFRRGDGKSVVLTTSFIGPIRQFVWHEQDGTVEAVLSSDGVSAVYSLK